MATHRGFPFLVDNLSSLHTQKCFSSDVNLLPKLIVNSESCRPFRSSRRMSFGKRICVKKRDFPKVSSSTGVPFGEAPYTTRGGKKAYLDELDILDILDPYINLEPFNKETYNAAAYLWKKIDDIPEERRPRLFQFLWSLHISECWTMSGIRFKVANPIFKIKDEMPTAKTSMPLVPEVWSGKINGVPRFLGWLTRFKMIFFRCEDGSSYGRMLPGFIPENLACRICPLYFTVREVNEVLATEEPCDSAFEFGDGQSQLLNVPPNFPMPAKHPWPFNDHFVIYVRVAGPSVLAGQAWIEGRELRKVPQQFLGELLLIKDHASLA